MVKNDEEHQQSVEGDEQGYPKHGHSQGGHQFPRGLQGQAVADILVHEKAEQNQGYQSKTQIQDSAAAGREPSVEELYGNVPPDRRG